MCAFAKYELAEEEAEHAQAKVIKMEKETKLFPQTVYVNQASNKSPLRPCTVTLPFPRELTVSAVLLVEGELPVVVSDAELLE